MSLGSYINGGQFFEMIFNLSGVTNEKTLKKTPLCLGEWKAAIPQCLQFASP